MITGTIKDFAPDINKQAEELKSDIVSFFNIESPTRPLPPIYVGDSDAFFIENEKVFAASVIAEVQSTKEAWENVLDEFNLYMPIDGVYTTMQKERLNDIREELLAVGGFYLNAKGSLEDAETWEEKIFISEGFGVNLNHVLTHELTHFLAGDGKGSTGFKTPDFAKQRKGFNEACTSLLTLCYASGSKNISDLTQQFKKARSGEITIEYRIQTAQLLLLLYRMELNGVSNPVDELVSAYFGQDEKDINYYMFLMKLKANTETPDEKSAKIVEDCYVSLGI